MKLDRIGGTTPEIRVRYTLSNVQLFDVVGRLRPHEAKATGSAIALRPAREVRRGRLKPIVSNEGAHDEPLPRGKNYLGFPCLL